jgi:hypothetical protein
MVEKNNYKNLSVSICVDTEKLGEIIHWQKTGLLEAWHYKNLFGRCETTVDIAFFNEKDIRAAVEFAKYGEPSAYAIETKNNKPLKNKKD